MSGTTRAASVLLTLFALAGCAGDGGGGAGGQAAGPACDPDDGGLSLPDGFCATVVAEDVGEARHLTVAPNGDIYVAAYGTDEVEGGIVALRDTTGDAKADVRQEYAIDGGTGINLRDGWVYFAPDWGVVRMSRDEGQLTLNGPMDTVVHGFPEQSTHAAKSAAIDDEGYLYVNVGAPSNACQEEGRSPGSPGMDPCPQRERQAGVWRFHADSVGQTQADGIRFATGLRNTFALDFSPVNGDLYGAQHGRDQLHELWKDRFTQEASAALPSEEIVRLNRGDDFGWPYCYHDWQEGVKVLAPEYGGDGQEVGRCDDMEDPVVAFPGHWAPNGLAFYRADQFPAEYRNGAFVAWHGSWNRAPLPQQGYKVSFIPWDSAAGELSSDYRADWATGFAGETMSPRQAEHRPSGLAVGPDGSLYVSDDQAGTIWRIMYRGG